MTLRFLKYEFHSNDCYRFVIESVAGVSHKNIFAYNKQ